MNEEEIQEELEEEPKQADMGPTIISEKKLKELTSSGKPIILQAIALMKKNLDENLRHLEKHFEYVQSVRDRLLSDIRSKNRIFILASGRSAMVGQMFQTRLEHFGVECRFLTNSRSVPKVREGETILVVSGSGTTPIVKAMLESYLTVNPHVIVITSYPLSVIGRLGDTTVKLVGRTKEDLVRRDQGLDSTLAPEGTMFEAAALTFLDGIIAELAVALHLGSDDLYEQHNQAT